MAPDRIFRIGEYVVGFAVVILGLFVAIETFEMPATIAAAGGGPKLFPFIVAAGLVAVGGWLLFKAYAETPAVGEARELDWLPVLLIAAGFIVLILILELLGWIVAGTALFVMGARAFGSRTPLKDALIGIALASLTYAVFDYGLGLDLPMGSLIENVVDPQGEDA